MVPRRGLEPPRPCDHYDLNVARLPVPPPGHFGKIRLVDFDAGVGECQRAGELWRRFVCGAIFFEEVRHKDLFSENLS
jgi:hypothetical protein